VHVQSDPQAHISGLGRDHVRHGLVLHNTVVCGTEKLVSFRGISTLTALGLISEIGDFNRFSHPREPASWLGITPSEYSSGESQHRGHITKTGNRHARRLLVEAAWHYGHAPRRPARALNRHHAHGRPKFGCTIATGT